MKKKKKTNASSTSSRKSKSVSVVYLLLYPTIYIYMYVSALIFSTFLTNCDLSSKFLSVFFVFLVFNFHSLGLRVICGSSLFVKDWEIRLRDY